MTILTVKHMTTYSYASPVRLGEHRMMLRPRDSNDQRLLKASLDIEPRPHRLRWIHDVFDNCVAIADFAGETRRLKVENNITLEHIALDMRFIYWGCEKDRGRFIGFFDFLKEKNFIHALSPQEIQQLKQNVLSVNCCNCGAAIDLQTNSVCPYCHSPISMLDMKQQQQMLTQLKEAAAPRPVDAALPLKLALATEQTSALFKRG